MRRQATYIRCDGDGCSVLAEVEQLNETPAGWYTVQRADENGKIQPRSGWDFHSVVCVEKWAKGRKKISPAVTHESHSNGEVSPSPFGRRGVTDELRELILDLGDEEFTAPGIAEVTGAHSSTVRNLLREMVADGVVVQTHLGGSGPGNPSRYVNKKAISAA